MAEKSKLLLRMDIELHETLKKLATVDNRSLNNYIVTILENHVLQIKSTQFATANKRLHETMEKLNDDREFEIEDYYAKLDKGE